MTASFPLPDSARIGQILGLLFDGLEVKPGGAFDQRPTGGAWFGVFVTDDGAPVSLCGADASLAAGFGAALSMLPFGAASDAAKKRELSPVMIENLREIMNICTRLVMDGASPHLKLEQIHPVNALPAAAAALLAAAKGRREFQIQLRKYGGGVLTVLAA